MTKYRVVDIEELVIRRQCDGDGCSTMLAKEDFIFTGRYQDVSYPKAGLFFPRCPVIICTDCAATSG